MAEARIVVAVDPRRAVAGSRVAVRSFDDMTRAARRSDQALRKFDLSLNQTGDAAVRSSRGVSVLTRNLGQLRGILVATGAAAGATGFVRLTDTYALLNARLQLVSRSQQNFLELQRATFDSAQDTRSALQGTIDLFTDLARRTERFGVSQRDLLEITEAVNQSFRISGTSAAAQAGAIIQLGQAIGTDFAAGGQELNSILEQAPRLAKAVADGLNELGITSNATASDLKRLAEDGILNTENFIAALLNQTDRLDTEFRTLPRTVGNSLTQLGNVFLRSVGQASEVQGLTDNLTESIDNLAEVVESPSFQAGLVAVAEAISLIATAAARAVQFTGFLVDEFRDLQDAARTELFEQLAQAPAEQQQQFIREAQSIREAIAGFIGEDLAEIFGILPRVREAASAAATPATGTSTLDVPGTRAPEAPPTLEQSEISRVEQLLSRFGGPAEQRRRLNETLAFVEKARELGALTEAQATIVSEGVQRQFLDQQLAVIGAIDQTLGITLELEQRRRELQASTEALGLSEATLAELTADLEAEYADLLDPMSEVTREFQEQQIADRRARDFELLSRSVAELTEEYEKNIQALNELGLAEEERIRIARDLRVQLLEQRTDLEAGVERSLLKFVADSEDAATAFERAFNTAISSVNQSLEDFIVTGEVNVGNLEEQFLRFGTRAALQTIQGQAAQGLLSLFGFEGGAGDAGAAAAQTANTTALGTNTAALIANTGALNAASIFSGAQSFGTEVPFASSALPGGNPIATFLGSFQHGGSGRVPGGHGPPDSVVAVARVTPGEAFAFGPQAAGNVDVSALVPILSAIARNTEGTERNLRPAAPDGFGAAPSSALVDTGLLIQNAMGSNRR